MRRQSKQAAVERDEKERIRVAEDEFFAGRRPGHPGGLTATLVQSLGRACGEPLGSYVQPEHLHDRIVDVSVVLLEVRQRARVGRKRRTVMRGLRVQWFGDAPHGSADYGDEVDARPAAIERCGSEDPLAIGRPAELTEIRGED